MAKTQKDHDAKWVIVQVRLLPEEADDLDALRRAAPDLPSRAEMVRRTVAEAAKRGKKR